MVSPTVRRGVNQSVQLRQSGFKQLPLATRRCGAWIIEVSLIAASALVPFQIGLYAKSHFAGDPVPLNPVLAKTEEAIAKTLAIPVGDSNQAVAPLTNLFWSGALLTPLVLAGVNLYLLGKTGQTLPKRWLNVQVVSATGAAPGLVRAVAREGLGRWGLPLGVAYVIWQYSGAFPSLTILGWLSGILVTGGMMSARFDRQRRALHDRLAGTYVVDATYAFQPWSGGFKAPRSLRRDQLGQLEDLQQWSDLDEDAAIAAIVLTPEPTVHQQGLWRWMRQHPGMTLLIVSLGGMAVVLGTFVGTQIYIQSQANWRQFRQQDDTVYLQLVSQSTASNAPSERRGAILALGTLNDPRALQLLRDLLGQETHPLVIDAIQQALVSIGPKSLPYLQKLNQSLQNDISSLRQSGNQQELTVAALRQQATQRAIAKILTVYSGQIYEVDLSRTNLGQMTSGPAPFTLVLDNTDLAGIQLKGSVLTNASLQGARFYGPGVDGRWNTFDDWTANLSGADLKDANLTGALLSHVSLQRANLMRANLNKANLSYARLSGANLSTAKLIAADLRQAVLENASLTGAELSEANFAQTNLRSALLGRSSASGTQFQFANLSQTDWQGADLSKADLSQANLQNANLSATKLAGAKLNNAQLQNANLRDADLSGADLRGANLEETDFQNAVFVAPTPTKSDQFIKLPSTAPSVVISGVNFAKAKNLSAEQIVYICTYGGRHPQCR